MRRKKEERGRRGDKEEGRKEGRKKERKTGRKKDRQTERRKKKKKKKKKKQFADISRKTPERPEPTKHPKNCGLKGDRGLRVHRRALQAIAGDLCLQIKPQERRRDREQAREKRRPRDKTEKMRKQTEPEAHCVQLGNSLMTP